MMCSVEWSNHPEMGTPLSVLCSNDGIPIANKEFNENVVSSAINNDANSLCFGGKEVVI